MLPRELKLEGMFPEVTSAQWRTATEAELKGQTIASRLVGHLYGGLDVQPLYTAEDWPASRNPEFPGIAPFKRGARPLGQSRNGWAIGCEILQAEPAEANAAMREEFHGGVSLIDLYLDAAVAHGVDGDSQGVKGWCGRHGVMVYSAGDMETLLEGIDLQGRELSIHAGASFLPAATLLFAALGKSGRDPAKTKIAFNADPLGTLMTQGTLPGTLERALAQMSDLATWTGQSLPGASSVLVSGLPCHQAGASSALDLGAMLAIALEYLRALTGAGLDLSRAVSQMRFQVALGCRFFEGIARLRALRRMWAKALDACGGMSALASTMTVVASTGRRVLTRRDPWVNLLRNTTACFAGAVGGADAFITLPMDAVLGAGEPFTRRLARNSQWILREECHLHKVVDPAGGSWFLESLTDQLAASGWAELQAIEAQGGMVQAVRSGWIANRIGGVEARRERDVATNKAPITGVSRHPDILEPKWKVGKTDPQVLPGKAQEKLGAWRDRRDQAGVRAALAALRENASDSSLERVTRVLRAAACGATVGELSKALAGPLPEPPIAPLVIHRYAAAFEEIRDAVDASTRDSGGKSPHVFLANLGSPREFMARATYALDFFESGGFEPVNNQGFNNVDSAIKAAAASNVPLVVICSTDARYETDVPSLAAGLKVAGVKNVVLAGNPGAHETLYRQAGVDHFIFVKCDVLATLRELLLLQGVNLAPHPESDE